MHMKSISEGSVTQDFLEIATAVAVSVWSWENFSPFIYIVLISFHVLVLMEYWILKESSIPLKAFLKTG